MDTVNIHNHNQMEQYDFSKPINVTIIYEDDDYESSDKKIRKKDIKNDNNKLTLKCLNKKHKPQKPNIVCDITDNIVWIENAIKEETAIEEQSYNNNAPNATDDITEKIQTTHESETNNPDQNMKCLNNKNLSTEQNTICDTISNRNISDNQNGNNHEELDDYIDALLNVVAENLILIMRPYHYYYHRKKEVTENIIIYLNKLKIHFFDLSYSSVVTLILPQESNEKFVQNFIDKTVNIANKVLTWKCEQKNVEPFYNEMIIWTKKKRDQIIKLKTNEPNFNKIANNNRKQENMILKEYLATPPKQLYLEPPKNALGNIAAPVDASIVNPSDQILNAKTRKCILSAGPPGREITINIDSDTLLAHNNQYKNNNLQNHVNEMCRNTHNTTNIYAPNVQLASSQAQYYNVDHQNAYHQSNTIHYKPPPPAYNNNQHHNTQSPYYVYNHIQENIAHNIRNSQTQRNFNQFVAPAHSNSNIGQMYSTHSKEQITPINPLTQLVQYNNHPIITSCVSINSRCCICGKTCVDTRTRCSKCNKLVYCGYLCQELDAGSHNTLCGKT